MICHHCGRDKPDDEMFCLACGEALRAEPDEPEVVLPEPPQQPVRQEPVEEDYGETEPYFATKAARRRMQREQEYRAQEYYPDRDGGQLPARRRKSRAPFLIVSHLTAFIAALCFWLPFREWVSFHYSLLGFEISDGRLTLSELAKRFYDNRGILSLVTGTENEYLSSMIPDYVNESSFWCRSCCMRFSSCRCSFTCADRRRPSVSWRRCSTVARRSARCTASKCSTAWS